MMKQQLPKVLSNPVSLIGLVIAVFNIGFIVFLSVVEAFSTRAHPYADLVIWLVLPALVLFGVVLIIVGVRRERRRERDGAPVERRFLVVDFNDPKHRKTAGLVLMAFLLLSLLYAFAGLQGLRVHRIEDLLRDDVPSGHGAGIPCPMPTRSMPRSPAPTAMWGPAPSIFCSTS